MAAHTVAKVKDEFTMLFEVDTYFHSCSCRPAAHSYRACFVAGEPGGGSVSRRGRMRRRWVVEAQTECGRLAFSWWWNSLQIIHNRNGLWGVW